MSSISGNYGIFDLCCLFLVGTGVVVDVHSIQNADASESLARERSARFTWYEICMRSLSFSFRGIIPILSWGLSDSLDCVLARFATISGSLVTILLYEPFRRRRLADAIASQISVSMSSFTSQAPSPFAQGFSQGEPASGLIHHPCMEAFAASAATHSHLIGHA